MKKIMGYFFKIVGFLIISFLLFTVYIVNTETSSPEVVNDKVLTQPKISIEVRKEKTKQLVERLKTIPTSEFQNNRILYSKLVELNPGNERFKAKELYYKKKIMVQEFKRKQKENFFTNKYGKKPIRSGYDGSYFEVKKYLDNIANDPDSVKIDNCIGVYKTNDGWLVGCKYRGRNAFGGMVKQFNWFLIGHNKVLGMFPMSAYNVKKYARE